MYKNIMDDSWEIAPTIFEMRLRDGKTYFRQDLEVEKPPLQPRGYSGDVTRKTHPHVLNGDAPCLGDFLGALVDAREIMDFSQIVTIAQLFLEQANVSDDAGQHYAKWMLLSGMPNTTESVRIVDNCRSRTIQENGWKVFIGAHDTDQGPIWRVPFLKNGVTEVFEVPYGDERALLRKVKAYRRKK
jgi:hypothetical protein